MTKLAKISELVGSQKVVPVVVIENAEQAVGLAQALLDGGMNVIEITLRNTYALEAIKLIKKQFPQMIIMAGTVCTAEQLRAAVDAGADSIVSPGVTNSLLDTARELNIPYLPGVATASEILLAVEYGLTECKLFPATVVGGLSALKAFNGPYGDIRFCPTGGVTADYFNDFLALPHVMCVGGSWLAPTKMVREGDWQGITQLAKAAG